MKCTNCGHELAENTQFCGSCGQRNDRPQQQQPAAVQGEMNASPVPAVSTKPKSSNTLMLVLAGLGTGIGYILSFAIANVVCTALSNRMDTGSLVSFQMINYLNPVLSFFIGAIVTMMCGAISCKKTNELLKFFACGISGQAMAGFIGSAITTIVCFACYLKDTDIPVYMYSQILIGIRAFSAVIAAVLVAFILRCMISQEALANPDYADNAAQGEAPLNSDSESLFSKRPKSRGAAIVLCIFLGALGIHRFYAEKIGTGILWLLTGGMFGIGAIVDFFMLLFGTFKDADGLRL